MTLVVFMRSTRACRRTPAIGDPQREPWAPGRTPTYPALRPPITGRPHYPRIPIKLVLIPAQVTTGYQFYSGNFVNVRNEGLEIALATRNMSPRSAFQWNTTLNIAFNKNFVTKLPNGNRDFIFGPPWFQQSLTIGEPLFN